MDFFPLCDLHEFAEDLLQRQPLSSVMCEMSVCVFLVHPQNYFSPRHDFSDPSIPACFSALWVPGHSAPAFTLSALAGPINGADSLFLHEGDIAPQETREGLQTERLRELVEIVSLKVLDAQLKDRFLQRVAEEIYVLRANLDEDELLEELEAKLHRLQISVSKELKDLRAAIDQRGLFLPAKRAEVENINQVMGKKIRELQRSTFESLVKGLGINRPELISEDVSSASAISRGYELVSDSIENSEPLLDGASRGIKSLEAEIQEMDRGQKNAATEVESLHAELEKNELQLVAKENVEKLEALLAAKDAEIQNLKQKEVLLTTKEQEIEKLKQSSAAKIKELQHLALDNLAKSEPTQSKRKSPTNFLNYIGKKG